MFRFRGLGFIFYFFKSAKFGALALGRAHPLRSAPNLVKLKPYIRVLGRTPQKCALPRAGDAKRCARARARVRVRACALPRNVSLKVPSISKKYDTKTAKTPKTTVH